MFTTDPIADMLTRIRNSNQRKAKNVSVSYSKINLTIANILKKEGYIQNYQQVKKDVFPELVITLKYKGTQRVISGLKRISKPGLRVYTAATDIPSVLSGYGIAIISTSQGIMTDQKARQIKIGGEVVAYVW